MPKLKLVKWGLKSSAAALALSGLATTAQAYETKFGEVSIVFDTTVSMGASMRTADRYLRKGVGAAVLGHIIAESKRRSYRRLSLETGSTAPFAPAISLYERFGFRRCGPFGDYVLDPFSVYMTMEL